MSNNYHQSNHRPRANAKRGVYFAWYQRLLVQHSYALSAAIGRISRTPIATLMTIAVIGLALVMPAGLLMLLNQAQTVVEKSRQNSQISLFVAQTMTDTEIDTLLADVSNDRRVSDARYISPSEVMQEFQVAAGIGEWTQQLEENPLPGIIEITPAYHLYKAEAIMHLVDDLKQLPNVEMAQLDVEWLNRLQAIVNMVYRAAILLFVLVGVGVVLIIANTIRLIQELYRDELEIMRLVGADFSFISRPFVYSGLFYGILGGIVAWLILDFFIVWLREPLQNIFLLYHSSMTFSELNLASLVWLVAAGAVLGLIGSFSSVLLFSCKHEREILL